MTYPQAQKIYKKRHRKGVKNCWIADIKSKHGKKTRKAPNRIFKKPKYPCPEDVKEKLEKILKELGMI